LLDSLLQETLVLPNIKKKIVVKNVFL